MGDAVECASLQLSDEEVALGVAQRLFDAVVGKKRCELSIIAIQRRLPNRSSRLRHASFSAVVDAVSRQLPETRPMQASGSVLAVRASATHASIVLTCGCTRSPRNGRVNGRDGEGEEIN